MSAALLLAALAIGTTQLPVQSSATFTVGITIVRSCTVPINGVSMPVSCTRTGQQPVVVESTPMQKTDVNTKTRVVTIIY